MSKTYRDKANYIRFGDDRITIEDQSKEVQEKHFKFNQHDVGYRYGNMRHTVSKMKRFGSRKFRREFNNINLDVDE